MRCKMHLSDISSAVGVCASCLRERLFTLIAAQARQQAQAQAQAQAQTQEEDRRKSDAHHPPRLVFPRSVSPYIYRGSNNDSSWQQQQQQQHHQFDQRFYRTPQVGPTLGTTTTTTTTTGGATRKKKHKLFSLLASLFGSRSEEPKPEPDVPDQKSSRASGTSFATSPSSSPISQTWLSALIPNRRKKQSRLVSLEDSAITDGGRRLNRREDRGLSPARATVEDYSGDFEDLSAYSSECSPYHRKQGLQAQATPPQATPTRARRPGHPRRQVSGLAVCFSPLVRGSPTRHHRNVGALW